MIEWVTCEDCLQDGKERQPFEWRMEEPMTSMQCPYCGAHINIDKTLT